MSGVPFSRRGVIAGPLDAERVAAIVRDEAPRVLPGFLPERRWFGEKDRAVRSVAVDDQAVIETDGGWLAIAVVRVVLDGGAEAPYFVPLALVGAAPEGVPVLAHVETDDGRRVLVDALATEAFPRWFLERLRTGGTLAAERGRFVWESLPGFDERFASAIAAPPEVGSAEQSNSSVRYGHSLVLKVFRRLRPGRNPEEEIGRYLATRTAFRRLPLPLGTARYVDVAGEEFAVALAQAFEPNVGDGWSFALRLLASSPADLVPTFSGLGDRTARLHLALGRETEDAAFAPEVVSAEDARRWEAALRERLGATATELRRRRAELDPSLRDGVGALTAALPELERRAAGFRSGVGRRKIRVHGDYHLGQVLRTPDGDWTILDFEGEPARPIAERRAKTSPLKDVAGMLRSFGYARSAALRAAGGTALHRETLRAWEADARTAFLGGYRGTITRGPAGLIPDQAESFRAVLGAWELDKAVYELRYELSNRPDWIGHALATLVREP